MRAVPWRWSALFLPVLTIGCSQPVREDRTIHWDASGRQVAFQHGREGAFVADREGGGLRKIFQPGADVDAVGAPLWEPGGRRVLFTTARAGNAQGPIVYTCWLANEGVREPRALFEARCDHDGYIVANLAVGWHPQGKKILYIDQVGPHSHTLMEHDLESGRSRRALPVEAEALVFDWAPDGSRLACVLGGAAPRPATDGLWIGLPGADGWWHVPDSKGSPTRESSSTLERLRAGRPAWTPHGGFLAFVLFTPDPRPGGRGRYRLRAAAPGPHVVKTLAESEEPFRDLHWRPDAGQLGYLRGVGDGPLFLLRPDEPPRPAALPGPIRRFVGWNAQGDRLACIEPGLLPGEPEGAPWALALMPDATARDAIRVADGSGEEPGEIVFSGMRITFAQWSPAADKLSLWATFTPTHSSPAQPLLGGLRPGDPAAIFDLKTREMRWLPVDAQEKEQIGHHHLLKRQYAEAWRWYDEAEDETPKAEAAGRSFLEETVDLLYTGGPPHPACFHSYCLSKLGEPKRARAKLDEFRAAYPQRLPKEWADHPPANDVERRLREQLREGSLTFHFRQDFCLAQMFLSVDAVADGEAFFQEALEDSRTDEARLSRALVLSQLYLLRKRFADYAALATEKVAPLLLQAVEEEDAAAPGIGPDWLGMLGVAPLAMPEFLAQLPQQQVETMLPRWQRLRDVAATERSRYGVDLVLHALYGRLDRQAEQRKTADRLRRSDRGGEGMPTLESVLEGSKRLGQAQRAAKP